MEMRVIECATGKCSAANCTAAAAARTGAAARREQQQGQEHSRLPGVKARCKLRLKFA